MWRMLCLLCGAFVSVSEDLLCAFELLKPLDGPALRKEMTKAKRKRYVSLDLHEIRSLNAITALYHLQPPSNRV